MSRKVEEQNRTDSTKIKEKYFSNNNVNYKYDPDSIKELLNEDDFKQNKAKFEQAKFKKHIKIAASCVAACLVLVFGFGYFKSSMLYNIDFIASAKDYGQVARAVRSIKHKDDKPFSDSRVATKGMDEGAVSGGIAGNNTREVGVMAFDSGTESATPASSESETFSGTNEQVLGVNEGDIVKTNGEYIFVVSNIGKINAIKPDNNGNMVIMDTVYPALERVTPVLDMYLTKEKSREVVTVLLDKGQTVETQIYSYADDKFTLEHTFSQDGRYVSSRVTDNCLYTVTTKYTDVNLNVNKPEGFIPTITQDGEDNQCIEPRDITILPEPSEPCFIVATGINLGTNGKDRLEVSSKAILGSGYEVYCSTTNMYVMGNYKNKTNIIKFELNKGNIKFATAGEIEGSMLNQFSADEYDGYFRVATTKQNLGDKSKPANTQRFIDETENLVTILDKDLKVVSVLDNIAMGERIYSARFMEDTAYMVTFRQTDPLYVINLKDPKNPKLDGKLKIPGFSNYLHPLNDNKLLGIGSNTNENGSVIGFKMSLFDVSNPSNPTELDTVVVGGGSHSMVDMTHKALFYDSSKNVIGFPLIGVNNDGVQTFNGYVNYKIENNKFVLENKFEPENMVDEFGVREYTNVLLGHVGYEFNCYRAFYIDNIFYIYGNDNLSSFGYNNYKYLNNIVIK